MTVTGVPGGPKRLNTVTSERALCLSSEATMGLNLSDSPCRARERELPVTRRESERARE
jgi:hypothetical protein